MKNKTYCLLLIILCIGLLSPAHGVAKGKKKGKKASTEKSTPAKPETEYDKLFKNKKVTTVDGLMKIHFVDGKTLLLEVPKSILHRDFILTSEIGYTSDANEGLVGALGRQSLSFNFVKVDSTMHLRQLKNIPISSDENISKAIANSNTQSTLFKYDIKAYTPDSSAYVVDITSLFFDESRYTSPFPAGANSSFGFVDSNMSYKKDKSSLLGINGGQKFVTVQCQLAYELTKKFFGLIELSKEPLLLGVNRHMMLLPEQVMASRPADPRLNLTPIPNNMEYENNNYLKGNYRAVRWDITPSDSAAYARGELVEPAKPLIFYMDNLIPEVWKKAAKDGFEAWNKSFEKIGFKNVVRVLPMPNDASIDLNDPNISWIKYTANMIYVPTLNITIDPRSGEVLSSRLILPTGIADGTQILYKVVAMIHEPESRCRVLPDSKMYELLRLKMMDYAGRILGFRSNTSASFAYNVEDLRSPEFTQKNGLSPSIMGNADLYNTIAQPEDVAKGVRITQIGIGQFDDFAIKCLYKPMQATTFKDKGLVLDKWIGEVAHNPIYQYRQGQLDDFSVLSDNLGNDHTLALKYRIENIKLAMANFTKWYAEDDTQIDVRSRMFNLLRNSIWHTLDNNEMYVGGMMLNDDYIIKNGMKPFVGVPRKKQEEAVKANLKVIENIDWMYTKDLDEISMMPTDILMTKNSCFGRLLKRTSRLAYANQIATDPECVFPVEDYYSLLYDYVFGKTKRNEKLSAYDITNQAIFINMLITSANMHEFIGTPPPMPGMPGAKAVAAIASQSHSLMALGRTDVLKALVPKISNDAEIENSKSIKMDVNVNTNVPEPKSAYYARGREFQVPDYVLAPMFFKSLEKTKTLLEKAVANSRGEDRMHYQHELFIVKNALDARPK